MASYTKPDERLDEQQLVQILEAALPPYAYRPGPRSWTWTRQTGVWHINLGYEDRDRDPMHVKARLEGSPSPLSVIVRATRYEIDAALRFLVAVGAIDRHPDDPIARAS